MKEKKQLILRINPTLWEDLTRIADDDCRSLNGQIEYILIQAVRNKRTKEKIVVETLITDLSESDASIVIRNFNSINLK